MLTLCLFTLFVIAICSYIYFSIRKRYNYWKDRGIVHEEPRFIVGNFSFFMRKSFWEYFYDLKKKFPQDCVGIYLGLQPGLVVQSPELAKKVLVDADCFQHRFTYSGTVGDPIGSLNLFVSKGRLRKDLQQAYSPLFTTARLKTVTTLMNINAQDLKEKIQKDFVEQGKRVNIKKLMTMYVTDTLAFSVFGLRLSTLKGEKSPLWDITSHITKCNFSRGMEILTIFFIPSLAEALRMKFFSGPATEIFKKMFWSVVKLRQANGEKNNTDLLDYFLKLRDKFAAIGYDDLSENLMLSQAAAFIMASIETTTVTLTYTIFELAYHQEEQEKLYNEINDVLRRSGKNVLDYTELSELKYLIAVINETLRKCVPLQHLDRVPVNDYQLTDDIVLEKGIPIMVNVAALHHDERFFPEPNEWRPERFLTSSEFDALNYTFLPFGEGHRSCIGKRYGMLQLKTALVKIVHNFRIEPIMPYELKSDPYSIVLAPIDGASVKFVPR
ncbi:unnamed protein product [Pieris macdunnoughi]|uniref:unspecific monooxygenase n=1 Tax=Pieris macdunnoughi TaxID=345717 RepID=A0A821RAY2_9NEOP|nr:unnamed protein product [Pieris macdunnoughi]